LASFGVDELVVDAGESDFFPDVFDEFGEGVEGEFLIGLVLPNDIGGLVESD
jgi:hypothetical protein